MFKVKVESALWESNFCTKGFIEKWFVANGAIVTRGEPVAQLRIKSRVHNLHAPEAGCLVIDVKGPSAVEPGSTIGHVLTVPAANAWVGKV